MRCDNGTLDTRFYRPFSVTSARYSHAVQITALLKKETILTSGTARRHSIANAVAPSQLQSL